MTNSRNGTQEEHYLLKMAKGLLPQVLAGAVWASVTFAVLQANVANLDQRVSAMDTEKVDKVVIETQLKSINQQLSEIKSSQTRIENLFIEHVSK